MLDAMNRDARFSFLPFFATLGHEFALMLINSAHFFFSPFLPRIYLPVHVPVAFTPNTVIPAASCLLNGSIGSAYIKHKISANTI